MSAVVHQPFVHDRYEVALYMRQGKMAIVSYDEGRRKPIAFIESVGDWARFVDALKSGADEDSAVFAIGRQS